ncbi:MAG: Bax inhibitor-1/YccA family protein [Muribaculum sp.]|nr:Bax inhibitor-1/YccA family protein [Muribaculum sp.]
MNYNPQTPPPYFGGGYHDSSMVKAQANAIMKRVYVRMFIGLLISAFCALGVASSDALMQVFYGNSFMYWVLFGAMIVMAIVIPSRLNRMSSGTVLTLFCLFSAIMGVSLAPIFIIYQLGTIVYTLFITAGTFGAMSVYGYFTKADLTKMGTFLIMALFGLIILTIVNIFMHSSTLMWIVSIAGVLIFVGLTAYDTQQVKRMAAANLEPSLADKLSTMAAMNLYLDFINLFLYLLRIFGGRDN